MTVAALSGCADASFPKIVVRMGEGGPALGANTRGPVVATDAAEADVIARQIMAEGGTAADAAVAAAFMLAAVLPSRAGLNARGACLAQSDDRTTIDVFDFTGTDDGGAMPAFARAMFTLHARDGAAPWTKLIAPAERLARFGVAVSPALASDLKAGTNLLADGDALRVFMSPRRQLLAAGETLRQPALADALDRVRALSPAALAGEVSVWRSTPASGENVVQIGATGAAIPMSSLVVSDGKATVACTLSMGQRFGRGTLKDGVLMPTGERVSGPTVTTGPRGILRRAAAPGFSGDNMIICRDTDAGVQCEARAQ